MPPLPDLIWQSAGERITISPAAGGRIVSWQRDGRELVMAPLIGEGGLYRILFAEEQYPGTSYASPHRVLRWETARRRLHSHAGASLESAERVPAPGRLVGEGERAAYRRPGADEDADL